MIGRLLHRVPAGPYQGLGHLRPDRQVPHYGGRQGDGGAAGGPCGGAPGGPTGSHRDTVGGLVGGRGVGLLDRQVAVVAGAVQALGVGAAAGEVFLPSMAIKMMIM